MSDYTGIMMEDINHKLNAILEGQAAMASVPGDIAQLKADMTVVKREIMVLKLAVKELSQLYKDLLACVSKIENILKHNKLSV